MWLQMLHGTLPSLKPFNTVTKTVRLEPWARSGEMWGSGAAGFSNFRRVLNWLSSVQFVPGFPPAPSSPEAPLEF